MKEGALTASKRRQEWMAGKKRKGQGKEEKGGRCAKISTIGVVDNRIVEMREERKGERELVINEG